MKWKISAFRIKYNIYKPYPEKHMALQKSYMHISFRKKNNTSKTIMQEFVGYRNLRQWQVCEHTQNAALSTVSDRFEGPELWMLQIP